MPHANRLPYSGAVWGDCSQDSLSWRCAASGVGLVHTAPQLLFLVWGCAACRCKLMPSLGFTKDARPREPTH